MNTMTEKDAGSLIRSKLSKYFGVSPLEANKEQIYKAVVMCVRDMLLEKRGAYNKKRGWTVPKDENPKDKGYLVKYPDGYVSWCPKAQFESQGFALEDGSKVTEKDILNFKLLGYQQGDTYSAPDGKPFTMIQMVYPTGFTDFATSACVDPKNYSEEIGLGICVEKINDRL